MSGHDKAGIAGSMSGGDKDTQDAKGGSPSGGGRATKTSKAVTSVGGKTIKGGSPSVGSQAIKAIKGGSPSVRGKATKVAKGGSPSARGTASKDDPMSAEEGDSDMRPEDIAFIMDCIRNTGDGVITVDVKAVADALNYKHTGSVSNRITRLKKKYNLPINTSNGGGKKSDSGLVAGPKTPNKVTKTRHTSCRTSKVKKSTKTVASGGDVSGDEGKEVESSEKIGIARYIGPTSESGSEVDEGALKESDDQETDDDAEGFRDIKVEEEDGTQDEV